MKHDTIAQSSARNRVISYLPRSATPWMLRMQNLDKPLAVHKSCLALPWSDLGSVLPGTGAMFFSELINLFLLIFVLPKWHV